MNSRPFNHYLFPFLSFTCVLIATPFHRSQADEIPEIVHYEDALQLAVENDPRFKWNEDLRQAFEGQIEQAGKKPNPTFETEIENWLGSGPFRNLDSLEVTISLSQTIETADKRNKRTQLAERKTDVARWQQILLAQSLIGEIRQAFSDILLDQKWVSLRKEQLKLAQVSLEETKRLLDAARVSQAEFSQARLAVTQQEFALQKSERQLQNSRTTLSALWGVIPAPAFSVTGNLTIGEPPPQLKVLVEQLKNHPEIHAFSGREQVLKASLDLEIARGQPDFELFGGIRYTRDTGGDSAFVAGLSIPWPVHDRNEGNIRTSQARLRALRSEKQAVFRSLLQRLNSAYQELTGAQAEFEMIQSHLLPSAEDSLEQTREGYGRGQFLLLSVLESQTALIDIREAELEAWQRYIRARNQIENLLLSPESIRSATSNIQ